MIEIFFILVVFAQVAAGYAIVLQRTSHLKNDDVAHLQSGKFIVSAFR